MIDRWQVLVAALAVATSLAAQADGRKVYKWVDDEGVVHFGDSVPPEYAQRDRDVLNDQGISVDRQQGALTPEERARQENARQAAEELQKRQDEARVRDETLLDTYLTVEEIESLRDRRAEMLDGQIHYTSLYLDALREKLVRLQADAARFRPYSSDPDAPPIHENLAKELSDTLDSIIRYEKTLTDARERKTELVAKFDDDIDRFRELKGIE
jgi:hypothetical protein